MYIVCYMQLPIEMILHCVYCIHTFMFGNFKYQGRLNYFQLSLCVKYKFVKW